MVTLTPQQSQSATSPDRPEVHKTVHYQIAIVGGGAAGITTASWLLEKARSLDIAIIEPSQKHYYQPGWTLTGGGVFQIQDTVKPQKEVLPKEVTWVAERAIKLDPENNALFTTGGLKVEYDCLIVCPGIQIDWHLIKGLKEAIGSNGVTSNYSPKYAPYTWELIRNFQGGNALFTFPNTPIKCGGAPQKIMYMADDFFRSKYGVRQRSNVMFLTPKTRMFSVPEYSAILENVVQERDIDVKFGHNLKEIKADTKEAVFDVLQDDAIVGEVSIHYDMIHVAPPQSAPDFIKESPLAVPNNPGGWVDVNKDTLQHNRYPNVFGIGDASSLPTSKTAAAVRKQAPVVAENLLNFLGSQPLSAHYDGYTCCPLITGYDKTVMAEFDGYNARPTSSFPLNPAKERWVMWVMKKHVLPWVYWNRMLKGAAFEGDYIKPLQWRQK
ncbi:NAD(P)/FAD-dependent oxidoreductase [Phormidium sp. CCY1219]|uniref:NAD(P)/FAD-dependent oxidoreductase n=1 Tax=Phormidium sp. CCY1219 TaxID=2886104 RepID=UPI002D1E773C|nr:FAD/NAD(P)-binding oxidoreductase [Phormidium sp. CCY1219]MEB3826190.1 NAD(P)/FAD-dependent oxidoreductase [Phormidium sp. CCY1219]